MSLYCDVGPEFYSETLPRARKKHRCVECKAPIEIGEPYLSYVGKWEGELDAGRQHLLCRDACMAFRDDWQDGECIPFGALKEALNEHRQDLREVSRRPNIKNAESAKRIRHLVAQVLWRERPYVRAARKAKGTNV